MPAMEGSNNDPPGVEPSASLTAPMPAAPWPFWQRFAFRFLLVYYVLYAFPRPLSNLLGSVAGAIQSIGAELGAEAGKWIRQAPLSWPGQWESELYQVERARRGVTTWLDERGLAPYEVIHQPTGSGDTGHDIVLCLVHLAAAALLAILWSVVRRRPCGYPGLGRWLHLVVRFDLAFWMLSYGSSKLYGSQFGELSLTRLTQEIGDTWPMSMVGTFMQAFPPYEVLGGIGEVLGGLLLFHRRTALLGALLTLVVMGNVCALNWLCGVPVKLFSLHLWLYALFLLAPWRHALVALLLKNRGSQPVHLRVPVWRWLRWPVVLGGWTWVLSALVLLHLEKVGPKPWLQGQEKSELYGVWLVERMVLDGVEVPVSDASRWRFFAIDRGTRAWTRDAAGKQLEFEFTWDPATSVAKVKKSSLLAFASPWTIVQGTKTVPVDRPLVRNRDRGKKVDGERRSLVLTGSWGGKQLELHTVEKRFRLQAGFRLRQELPDFW